ncbi:MAG TPA: hypothetical protein VGM51_05145 [Armatimonadota bacterium]|jgi:hypothetical protein
MGLAGGWWGVAGIALVAVFLAREFFKFQRGEVTLTPRQKVVRLLGGVLLMGIAIMLVYSPIALQPLPGTTILQRDALTLGYWGICLGMTVLLLLMAVMDAGEISRQYLASRKAIRQATITREDVDRILRADHKDHPDDVGK